VAIWEVYLAATDYVFIKDYANSIVEAQKLDGASEAELERLTSEAERFRVQYSNLLFRLPMTFLEIFPVGLLVSLGSAGVLRNHRSVG
jgi:hypothetical protein